ncbi:hypothetical protein HPB47_014541 [Ixodes persulcatus]|uniref:Uncharacterized protein n=1 Tax=Ixodes persulcatus TaxID=34615 RepID=A0AC60QWL4_IXOPE|nr:hypothetical protein HPB47_014541 [Ixodes persulcatus]
MADDASFADFFDFVLRVDELLYDGRDDNQPVDLPRRRCRDRLNPLEHFNEHEFLILLESLPLEASDRGLPLSPMLQLLIALRFYGAGTFQLALGASRKRRFAGSSSECRGRIFDNSRARALYEHGRVPGLLLGDAAYACTSFLLTPLTSPGAANSPEGSHAHLLYFQSLDDAGGPTSCRLHLQSQSTPSTTCGHAHAS